MEKCVRTIPTIIEKRKNWVGYGLIVNNAQKLVSNLLQYNAKKPLNKSSKQSIMLLFVIKNTS